MAEVTNVSIVTRELVDGRDSDEEDDPNSVRRREVPSGVEVFEISGAFFFGAAETFKDTLMTVSKRPKVLIIRMRDVSMLDATGLRALRDVVRRSRSQRTEVLVSEIHTQPLMALQRSALGAELGDNAIFLTLEDAIDRARQHLAERIPTPLATPVTGPDR
jgi:SulP family sulfate permease